MRAPRWPGRRGAPPGRHHRGARGRVDLASWERLKLPPLAVRAGRGGAGGVGLANGLSGPPVRGARPGADPGRPRGGGPGDPTVRSAEAKVQRASRPGPARAPVRPEPLVVEPARAAPGLGPDHGGLVRAWPSALFVGLPHALGLAHRRRRRLSPWAWSSLGFHVLDGLFKLAIFVAYIWGIGRIPEIAPGVRVPRGRAQGRDRATSRACPLSLPENARRFVHVPRALRHQLPAVRAGAVDLRVRGGAAADAARSATARRGWCTWPWCFIKVPLMLPLAGVRVRDQPLRRPRHPEQLWVQAIVAPGRLMQKLTTQASPATTSWRSRWPRMRAALAAGGPPSRPSTPRRPGPRPSRARGTVAVFQRLRRRLRGRRLGGALATPAHRRPALARPGAPRRLPSKCSSQLE
jgi:hypothetical protein